jgi:hypothetical protein
MPDARECSPLSECFLLLRAGAIPRTGMKHFSCVWSFMFMVACWASICFAGGAAEPSLRSARVTNAFTLPVEVRVTYGRYSASAQNASRQLTSATVVFPGDSAVFGEVFVQLREPAVVGALTGTGSSSCVQVTLPIDSVLACAFPSNDTNIPYTYPDSCASASAPYGAENQKRGNFLVLPATAGGSSGSAPVSVAYAGGEPAASALISETCSV